MTNLFSAETYKSRRAQLKKTLGSGKILFIGNNQSAMNYPSNHYPFRQDSTFLYFFGLDKPGLAATIDIDNDQDLIFGNELTLDDIVWEGPHPTLGQLAEYVGVKEVRPLSDLKSSVNSSVHYLPPYRSDSSIWLSELIGESLDWIAKHHSIALIKSIVAIRSVKESQEIEQLHDAVSITADMHLTAMKMAKPGMKESDIVGALLNVAASKGNFYAFPPIVTVNGQTLHNHYYGNELKSGRLLLCDSGAENTFHYAGDMTRTFPVDKKFDTRQREIYSIVLNALKASAESAKAGVRNFEIHTGAATILFDGLKELGLTRGNTEEAVKAGAHSLFFPHGLGHMMGLDVHDMEDYGEDFVGYGEELDRSDVFGFSALRLGRTLQEGFVLTIEPGLYFIPELFEQWRSKKMHDSFLNYQEIKKYLDFGGIRLENDYHITSEGAELLGKPLPVEIDKVENVR